MPRLTTVKPKLKEIKRNAIKLQRNRITGYKLQKRREEAYLRDGGICQACNRIVLYEDYELHHTIPLSEGGEDIIENTEVLCSQCHHEHHHKQV